MKVNQLLCVLLFVGLIAGRVEAAQKPNIVYIMSDELAYYELGHMGNPFIRTPRIDRMAAEGLRFTNALAGAPVCAPLRCNLLTGKHAGHASVRANGGGTPLRLEEATIGTILNEKGYATGGFGKWGVGGRDSTGVPEKHGFDVFYGYYDQVHAHSFYPPYLIRNSKEVVLPGNKGGRAGKTYSHYSIMDEAVEFIRDNKDQPFFCYLPITPPHGMYDIPANDPAWEQYKDDAWMKDPAVSGEAKNYAAMVTMVDNNVGTVLDLLTELGLEENTIVFFAGDNGGQDRFKSKSHPRGYFGPNVHPKTGVEFRSGKGSLYEGGLVIPSIVRWPGKIKAGQVSDLVFYHPDILPTLAELTGARVPKGVDGMSILPEILGEEVVGRKQSQHKMMYWEYRGQVAVRQGQFKAIRPRPNADWEFYDLAKDPSEINNIAGQYGDLLKEMKAYATASHEDVREGTFSTTERHERDRKAKWGTSRDGGLSYMKSATKMSAKGMVPFGEMKVIRFSSQNYSNDRMAAYAIDPSAKNVWHSQFTGKKFKHPHELVIDLGGVYDVTGFKYLARQDRGYNGAFAETEFYVSDSPDKFQRIAAKTTFKKVKAVQSVDCKKSVVGRYVLVRILSEVDKKDFASASVIGVEGTTR
jgi:arylsulfatase A-like enzyme